jgi:hypothetical protein
MGGRRPSLRPVLRASGHKVAVRQAFQAWTIRNNDDIGDRRSPMRRTSRRRPQAGSRRRPPSNGASPDRQDDDRLRKGLELASSGVAAGGHPARVPLVGDALCLAAHCGRASWRRAVWPVTAAAAALGHDPAVFLRTYAHLYPGDLKAVADAMDMARGAARGATNDDAGGAGSAPGVARGFRGDGS